MNVYKINKHWVAAKDANTAFSHYLDETTVLDDVYFGVMDEGEEDEYSIKIKRLTSKEMDFETITCCNDGCSECEDRNEPVLYSFREKMNRSENFPSIICWEE